MVDIGDVNAETWWYVLLFAAQFLEVFGSQHSCCHVREVKIELEGVWKSGIFV